MKKVSLEKPEVNVMKTTEGRPRALSLFAEEVRKEAMNFGKVWAAHLHLDRANTLGRKYLKRIGLSPLAASAKRLTSKQHLTGYLHTDEAYVEADLEERMDAAIMGLIDCGVTHFSTCIDATPDLGKGGLIAIHVMRRLIRKHAKQIKGELGPQPIFGFKEKTRRWDVYKEAAKMSDFLAALPKRDMPEKHDGRIGFEAHLDKVMELACQLGKPVHVHLDQDNDPREAETEDLIQYLRFFRKQPCVPGCVGPTVWAIHMISPSCYDESRFKKLVDGLLKYNVGVIICPSAALSMRQLRPNLTPTHNSMARVLELALSGVPIRIGPDNFGDMYIPTGRGDMYQEIELLANSIRYYNPMVLAKMLAGQRLNEIDRDTIRDVIEQDISVFKGIKPHWKHGVQ